ncbi:MAG: MMPL family transporter, partial [Planctomycetaceae bacterium]|nr:MMPL family transporter [Planctomycetaceae bacterium]
MLLPFLTIYGEGLSSNNDIETWLPCDTPVRKTYDRFCQTFGADETVVIAFRDPIPEPARIAALAGRLHHLSDVSACWTRKQVVEMMTANDVDTATAEDRLVSLMSSPSGNFETLLVVLNRSDSSSRARAVRQIREQLEYCQLSEAIVAGPPVVATQLDMLGSRENTKTLFGLTLLVCGALLYLNVRSWKTSLALMGGNVLSIQATLSLMRLLGQEMNFILSSLPVMVMVFTTASSIHFIGQYNNAYGKSHALSRAMKAVVWPSIFAAATTVIGLLSLVFSNVGPIPGFGKAASLGTVVSFFVGIGLTPAILSVVRYP